MRIHSNLITTADLGHALLDAQVEATGVFLDTTRYEYKRGRKFAHSHYHVSLEGVGARHTRQRNSGQYGGTDYNGYAATWMDWGWFIAVLFRYDPDAQIGFYKGRDDFHEQTQRQIAHRLGAWGRGDRSVQNFARQHATSWPTPLCDEVDWLKWPIRERVESRSEFMAGGPDGNWRPGVPSPFTLVDTVCPPNHLITLHPVERAIAWLDGPDTSNLVA